MSVPSDVRHRLEPNDPQAVVRRHPRTLFSVPITLQHLTSGGIRKTRGISLDLAEGGLGALVQGELQLGETVGIELSLRERPLSTIAIVRHTSSIRSGFEFLGLTPEERLQIANLIKPDEVIATGDHIAHIISH
jgi:hypothetical protein